MKEALSWVKSILLALIVVFICREFLFEPVMVKGESMRPTYEDADKIIVSKLGEVQRFDQIVFHAPDADENYIKRVIGLPGDRVEMKDDVLYINGKEYKEPYLQSNKEEIPRGECLTEDFTLYELWGENKVPQGSFFVMGDNRRNSYDSRRFGFISEKSLIGKAEFRFYPFNEAGIPR